ncbi:hypothetical protein CEUSTIGMA_g2666.t1 [Chlamydomonas eustigma]|uniref:Major facilitator superfamily (MFS) profile domain-containing protein n=1 Tax=Chlamydomonas eustigma TaxID=1157962 RepID=A0A250WX77_9CHLO|nr:hypothetical protein CEUSTIGMA_g2666.t1 [Chlamydomonas eustigma]|eukprot:GAX75222.1 hypothetical protein CEUSTIGMA_g2666.t1 [Chlamydomonas eustigma]
MTKDIDQHQKLFDGENTLPSEASTVKLARYHTVCLIGYSLSFIIFGSQVSILGPTIKPLSEKLGVDETDLSPLFTALGVSCIISGTPSGWFVDRFPTHHVLIASLLIEAIGFSLVPLMPSVWSLTALYFIICFSYNFTNSAVFTSLGWMFPKKAGGALNLVLAMFGVGSFFIPLAAEACSQFLGSPLAVFWLVGAVSFLSTLPFLFVVSPQKPKPEAEVEGDDGNMDIELKTNKTLEIVCTTAVIVLVFCTTAAETAIGNWLFTFASKEMGLTDTDAALANSSFWGAFTFGRVVGVVVSPFTTPSVLLLASTPFSVAGAFIPLLLKGQMSWNALLLSAVLTGFGNSAGYANAVALLEQYVPVTGFINGIFGMVAGGACMVGPTMVALLVKNTSLGYNSMAWVGLFFYTMHFPLILTAMASGRKLLSQAVQAAAAAAAAGSIEEPLLPPLDAEAQQQQQGAPGHRQAASPVSFPGRPSYSDDVRSIRTSLPGHFGSLTGSLTRQRSLADAGLLGVGGGGSLVGSHHTGGLMTGSGAGGVDDRSVGTGSSHMGSLTGSGGMGVLAKAAAVGGTPPRS